MEYPIYESSRELSLNIPMEHIMTTDIQSLIETKISKDLESYHNGEGIVLPGTVSIISRSPLILSPKDSTYKVVVRYKTNVVDVPHGAEVNARVESILSSGLICHVYDPKVTTPLVRAYIPIIVHNENDQERLKSILKNDIIRIRSINRKGSYADKIITMIGTFVDLVERPDPTDNDEPLKALPAPANESVYDAKGDGDPLGPLADGMAPSPTLPMESSGVSGSEVGGVAMASDDAKAI